MTIRILLILLMAFPFSSLGYELDTHARLTQQAYTQSDLKNDIFLIKDLGLHGLDPVNPFNSSYSVVSGTAIYKRQTVQFEKERMPKGSEADSISGWLMRGAIREDDLLNIPLLETAENPQDDPDGDIFRVFHHFFDPINDTPLNGISVDSAISICNALPLVPPCIDTASLYKAVDWALGTQDAFIDPSLPDNNRRNHFTVIDACESMQKKGSDPSFS